jgi:transposase
MNNNPKKQYSIADFRKEFPDDDACLNKLFSARFGAMEKCPECGRKNKYKRVKGRKCFFCPVCYNQIYPCVGTPFEKSTTSLVLWFYAEFLFTVSKNGLSAAELERHLGVTYKTAYRMLSQIRKSIKPDNSLFDGIIEIDETFVGGKNKNRHKDKKVKNSQGRSFKDKTPVLGILKRGGNVSTHVVPDTKAKSLLPHIAAKVAKGSQVMTDEWGAYSSLGSEYDHQFVYHGKGEYVNEAGATTNRIENFWSIFKRTIGGSYIHVSRKHMQLYANEIAFRYNERDNKQIFHALLVFTFSI